MTSQHLQYILAAIFIGLGGWCMLMPAAVETLSFRPEYRHLTMTTAVLVGCFGAQAVLVGILALTAQFRPSTFLIFGLAGSLPFFAFNYYFYFVTEVFTEWMLLDFAGNLGILTLGLLGYQFKRREDGLSEAT